ncbi:hypothetical protein AX14_010715 [Amanita brunnescens Koide BX004]|nr:hypothetical protein AX14_010715 [Amanita brunnescens Koide BX004]
MAFFIGTNSEAFKSIALSMQGNVVGIRQYAPLTWPNFSRHSLTLSWNGSWNALASHQSLSN